MMKAFIVDRYGSSDNVRAAEMPDPEVRENDVLVQVRAAVLTSWIPRSETGNSSRSCLIACRSSWAMTWPDVHRP